MALTASVLASFQDSCGNADCTAATAASSASRWPSPAWRISPYERHARRQAGRRHRDAGPWRSSHALSGPFLSAAGSSRARTARRCEPSKTSSTMVRFFRSSTSVLPSVETDRIASASLILAASTASWSLPKIILIRTEVSSNTSPIAFTVSDPNGAPSINARAFIPQLHLLSRENTLCPGRMVPPKWGYSSAGKDVADVPGRRTPRSCAGSAAAGRTAGPIALARAQLLPRLKELALQPFAVAIPGRSAHSHNRSYG